MKPQINHRRFKQPILLSVLLLTNCNSALDVSDVHSPPTPEQHAISRPVANQPVITNAQTPTESAKERLKLYPVDESNKDSSLVVFREKLLHAARQHDSRFILNIVAPDILNSFGGEGGVDEFKEQWKLDQPNSKFWDELLLILSMGGSFMESDSGQEFCVPYVASQWKKIRNQLPKDLDSEEYAAVISENVPLKSQPDQNSPTVDTLSYDIIKFDSQASASDELQRGKNQWLKVITLSGKQGYILGEEVRSPADYHACFKKVEGHWIMTMFVAGD